MIVQHSSPQTSRRAFVIALYVALSIALYIPLRNDTWAFDDNLFLILAKQSGLSWDSITAPIFQHWGIGYHLAYSGIDQLMPVDYRWALVAMLAMLVGAMYMLQSIVHLLFGWGWRAVLIGAVFGMSVFFTRNLLWFASGLQALTASFFDLLCLYAYVRYQMDGARRWVALAAGALAAGLLFYERPALMLLYLALFRVLMMARDLSPRTIARAFWSERQMWAPLIVIAALWAIGYEASGAGAGLTKGTVSVGGYASFFRIMWIETLIPA